MFPLLQPNRGSLRTFRGGAAIPSAMGAAWGGTGTTQLQLFPGCGVETGGPPLEPLGCQDVLPAPILLHLHPLPLKEMGSQVQSVIQRPSLGSVCLVRVTAGVLGVC